MLGCCESESTLNRACLIIVSYTAVYNRDTYAYVSTARGVVGWWEGAVYLTSPGCPADIGLQLGKACYPCSG